MWVPFLAMLVPMLLAAAGKLLHVVEVIRDTLIIVSRHNSFRFFSLILTERHQHTLSQHNCFHKLNNVEMQCRS